MCLRMRDSGKPKSIFSPLFNFRSAKIIEALAQKEAAVMQACIVGVEPCRVVWGFGMPCPAQPQILAHASFGGLAECVSMGDLAWPRCLGLCAPRGLSDTQGTDKLSA